MDVLKSSHLPQLCQPLGDYYVESVAKKPSDKQERSNSFGSKQIRL